MKRRGRPVGTDGAATRVRLLDAAERHFSRVGYSYAKNQLIATEAGLSTSSIYHYFGSKRNLYIAVNENVHDIIFSYYEDVIQARTGLASRLRAVIEASIELHTRRPSLAGFLATMNADARRDPDLHGLLDDHLKRLTAFGAELVAGSPLRDQVSPDITEVDVANMIVALLLGFASFAEMADSPENHARAMRAFGQLVVRGLHADDKDRDRRVLATT